MHLTNLRLSHFRNFSAQELALRSRLNFFVGANGQGKTNLLEAVYMLSRGESFRPAQHEHFIQSADQTSAPHSPQSFPLSLMENATNGRLTAAFESEVGRRKLVVDFADRRRSATLDGKRTNFSTLAATFPVVLFSPESLASIKEGPDRRRELVDSLLTTRSERDSKILREYSKMLRSRNVLLRQIAGGDTRKSTRDSLESLTTLFLVLASQVTELRLRALEAILPYWRKSVAAIFADTKTDSNFATFDPGNLEIAYEISGQNAVGWSVDRIFDAISQRRRELAERELNLGGSLIGPHKHDLRFLLAQNDSRFYCSQGQQRALILAFKIAQINLHHTTLGRYPILLLDDVMSELDEAKRSRLMEYLEAIAAQVLITATDLTWSGAFPLERNAVFVVESGNVRVKEADAGAVRAVGNANALEDAEM